MEAYKDLWTYECSISAIGDEHHIRALEETIETEEDQEFETADVIVESERIIETEEIKEMEEIKKKEEEIKDTDGESLDDLKEPEFPTEFVERTRKIEEYWRVARKYLKMLQERRPTRYMHSRR
jgi:hypothetical protein